MEIIRGLHNLRRFSRGCVATIGSFDGVHKGHQHLFLCLLEKSKEFGLPAVVITFEPQPQEFFNPQGSPARLTRFRDKVEVIADNGIDFLLTISFNAEFSRIPAQQFIQQILVQQLQLKYLQVGDDFVFGKDRKGNFDLLKQNGEKFGFEVEKTGTVILNNERVSSTRIRQALETGDMELAGELLGRPYWMSGHVQHGDKRGRTIGFPTANIPLHRRTPAVSGVFVIRMWGKSIGQCKDRMNNNDRHGINGIANIGFRPTVDGKKGLLEVHLFDFEGDLYGKLVHIDFLRKIRSERKFESFDALKLQIEKDVIEARHFFIRTA